MSVAQPVSSVISSLTAAGVPVIQGYTIINANGNSEITEREISPIEAGLVNSERKVISKSQVSEHVLRTSEASETKITETSLQGFNKEVEKSTGEDKPIASSEQFERKRTASLAAALLSAEHAPGHKAIVHFVRPSGESALIECENADDNSETSLPTAETLIANLLSTLKSLEMSDSDRYTNALQRLQDLEQELRVAGAICPPNSNILDSVAKALSSAPTNTDVQIRYNTSRHTKSTKTIFETETPGMEGLDAGHIQQLHQQLINDLSASAAKEKTEPDGSASSVTEQKHESAAEGFTNDDGSVIVSKKLTRVVTTTRTTVPGDPEQNAGDLIRLKVNEQVYSGTVDPQDQHIRLVPIIQSQENAQQQQSQPQPQLQQRPQQSQ